MPLGADRLSAADRGALGREWEVDFGGWGGWLVLHRRTTLSLVAASCGFP